MADKKLSLQKIQLNKLKYGWSKEQGIIITVFTAAYVYFLR